MNHGADSIIAMQLKNDLWDFTLNFYQEPGVEESCLALQDQFDLSINRLIFACWCSCRGLVLGSALQEHQSQRWQEEITHPLRGLRYRVRQLKKEEDALSDCYKALRKAELACEQVELAYLYQQSATLEKAQISTQLLDSNLYGYIKNSVQGQADELESLITPLLLAARKKINLV